MSDRSRHPETLSQREKWHSLTTPGQRIRYIWDYYKLPILIACIGIYILGYAVFRHATHKDTVLYAALVNVSVGEQMEEALSGGFLAVLDDAVSAEDVAGSDSSAPGAAGSGSSASGAESSSNQDSGTGSANETDVSGRQVRLYAGWYLTDDPSNEQYEYVYATRMKVLACIDDGQLDVVLMDQEAFDAFAQNGYLSNLETFLAEEAPELLDSLQPFFVDNIEILEDNAQDVALDPSLEYDSVTDSYPMAISLDDAPLIAEAGFSDTVYFGILKNTPRREMAATYLDYLFTGYDSRPV